MMEMTTSYFVRIPLPYAKPRDHIDQCVRIHHEGVDPGGRALATALKRIVEWAEHHKDEPHPKLPGEWVDKSYLPKPVKLEGSCADVLDQLEGMHCKVRVVTTRKGEHPTLHEMAELFATPEFFNALTVVEPVEEWN